MPNPNIYGMALSSAKAELQEIKARYDSLAKRKSQLEAFIANAEPLADLPRQLKLSSGAETEISEVAEKERPDPLWKLIKQAINGKGSAFSVSDALNALERIGKPVLSPNKVQIVRNAMIKRTDTFRKLSPGTYAVIEAIPQEVKSQEPTEVSS